MTAQVKEVLIFKLALERLLKGNIPNTSVGICKNACTHYYNDIAKKYPEDELFDMTSDWYQWMEEQFEIWPLVYVERDIGHRNFGQKSISFPVGGRKEYVGAIDEGALWANFDDTDNVPRRKELLLFLIEKVNVLAEPILNQQAQNLSNQIGY